MIEIFKLDEEKLEGVGSVLKLDKKYYQYDAGID